MAGSSQAKWSTAGADRAQRWQRSGGRCAVGARVGKNFLIDLLEESFFLELSKSAQIDEVLELPVFTFRFFAQFIEQSLDTGRRWERPAVENLYAAR